MTFPFSSVFKSEEETAELAKKFALELKAGDVISMNGNLGAGKTFFIKRICGGWGIHNVTSPTFAIVNEYIGVKKVYHFDFYRINNMSEILDIGFNDYLNDDESVIFIEWGNMFAEVLPDQRFNIDIEMLSGESRKFLINKYE